MTGGTGKGLRRCHRCLRRFDGEGTLCPECGARLGRLRWLDLVSMTVLVLVAILFGLVLASSLGSSIIEEGRSVLSSLLCLAGVLLFILVVILVPILSYLFKREGV